MKRLFSWNNTLSIVAGLSILYVLSLLINLGHFNLQGEEPRRAIVSIEMLYSGDFIVPRTLGWEYFNKPPLFNWILAGFMYLSGSSSEFVLRLPSVLFLLLWGLCHFRITRYYFPKEQALLSTFFFLTVPELFFYGLSNGAEIDIFYSFIVYLQAISIFWFYQQKKWWSLFIWSWIFCAIGFLTKGFPSLVFQGMTLLALCVYARKLKIIFSIQHFAGILVFILLTGSFFYVYSKHGSWDIYLATLINESLGKWDGPAKSGIERLGSMAKFPLSLLKLLAPWCLIYLLSFKIKLKVKENPLLWFSLLFIIFNLWVYWVAGNSKLRYIYMFIPFFMNIAAAIYCQYIRERPALMDKLLRYSGSLFALVLGGVLALPFIYDLQMLPIIFAAAALFIFLFVYYKYGAGAPRIWLFIGGFILSRLIYAAVCIPLQKRGMFDYKELMNTMITTSHGEPIIYNVPPDTLNTTVVLGDTLYRSPGPPVLVPSFLYHQLPYYFYQATGSLMKYETTNVTGKLHLTYQRHIGETKPPVLFSFYDKRYQDSLILIR